VRPELRLVGNLVLIDTTLKCDALGSGPRARYDQTSFRAVMTKGAGGLIPRAHYSEGRFRAQALSSQDMGGRDDSSTT